MQRPGGARYYLGYDQVGSLRAVADDTGAVVKQIAYDSFGAVLSETNATFELPFGFAGGLRDADTGLTRFGFRDYDPEIGRWTAKDPIGFSGGDNNLYGYCVGNPVNLTDPAGLLLGGRINAGEGYGQSALDYYASLIDDPCAGALGHAAGYVGGFFAALWTDETSTQTLLTLGSEGVLSVGGRAIGALLKAARAESSIAANSVDLSKVSVDIQRRTKLGKDGAVSIQRIEKYEGKTISQTHTVIGQNGEAIHQHTTYVGKYGGEATMPEEWLTFPEIL